MNEQRKEWEEKSKFYELSHSKEIYKRILKCYKWFLNFRLDKLTRAYNRLDDILKRVYWTFFHNLVLWIRLSDTVRTETISKIT